eukprot:g1040.t1
MPIRLVNTRREWEIPNVSLVDFFRTFKDGDLAKCHALVANTNARIPLASETPSFVSSSWGESSTKEPFPDEDKGQDDVDGSTNMMDNNEGDGFGGKSGIADEMNDENVDGVTTKNETEVTEKEEEGEKEEDDDDEDDDAVDEKDANDDNDDDDDDDDDDDENGSGGGDADNDEDDDGGDEDNGEDDENDDE